MNVKRIVCNIAAADVEKARTFYQEILGLEVLMTLAGSERTGPTRR